MKQIPIQRVIRSAALAALMALPLGAALAEDGPGPAEPAGATSTEDCDRYREEFGAFRKSLADEASQCLNSLYERPNWFSLLTDLAPRHCSNVSSPRACEAQYARADCAQEHYYAVMRSCYEQVDAYRKAHREERPDDPIDAVSEGLLTRSGQSYTTSTAMRIAAMGISTRLSETDKARFDAALKAYSTAKKTQATIALLNRQTPIDQRILNFSQAFSKNALGGNQLASDLFKAGSSGAVGAAHTAVDLLMQKLAEVSSDLGKEHEAAVAALAEAQATARLQQAEQTKAAEAERQRQAEEAAEAEAERAAESARLEEEQARDRAEQAEQERRQALFQRAVDGQPRNAPSSAHFAAYGACEPHFAKVNALAGYTAMVGGGSPSGQGQCWWASNGVSVEYALASAFSACKERYINCWIFALNKSRTPWAQKVAAAGGGAAQQEQTNEGGGGDEDDGSAAALGLLNGIIGALGSMNGGGGSVGSGSGVPCIQSSGGASCGYK
jgi:hypothetical protein